MQYGSTNCRYLRRLVLSTITKESCITPGALDVGACVCKCISYDFWFEEIFFFACARQKRLYLSSGKWSLEALPGLRRRRLRRWFRSLSRARSTRVKQKVSEYRSAPLGRDPSSGTRSFCSRQTSCQWHPYRGGSSRMPASCRPSEISKYRATYL
jgi:hypothetical protein